jgi:hypothetical protein
MSPADRRSLVDRDDPFVSSAMSLAQCGRGLDALPQDVPEIFVDYLRRVYAGPESEVRGTTEDEFIRSARVLARMSLGAQHVPGDFSPNEAKSALAAAALSDSALTLLEALISGGVLERRTFGGIAILRFSLDPVAEYLAAIEAVLELRSVSQTEVVDRVKTLTAMEGYPTACDGYLKGFAVCYRAFRRPFGLPEMTFPWETGEELSTLSELRSSLESGSE